MVQDSKEHLHIEFFPTRDEVRVTMTQVWWILLEV